MEHTELYEILGVSKDSTDADIKKNYRKLAKEFHPDKNPESGDKFKEISFAYEVLSDPEKRKTYDRFGLKGLQEGNDHFSDDTDFFSQWFPFGQAHGRPSGGRRKAAHVMVRLEVTLEELYNGTTKTVEYQRSEFCELCDGQGGPKEAVEKCANCGGTGSYHFVGLSAFETTCPTCNGRCTTIKPELRCAQCSGNGLRQVPMTRDITVDKGAPNMLKIPFASEGNQQLVGERGDLIVMLVQQEHAVFLRRQNDLFLAHIRINLAEALCGYVHVFKHLDGRDICIRNTPGEVIRHGSMKVIAGEGMPLRNNPFEKGDLFVEFRVEFPENNFATAEQLKTLEALLPPREPFVLPEDAELVQLVDAQPYGANDGNSEDGASLGGAHGGNDEDQDYDSGPHFEGVQCQTA